MARPCRRNGRCRNSGFPRPTSRGGGRPTGSARAQPIALAPGSVGASKRWTYYPEAARLSRRTGLDVWVVGGPGEQALAAEIVAAGGRSVRDLTGPTCATAFWPWRRRASRSRTIPGLMHVAAALGTPTMGIFGPTSPYHWAPLNGLAATVQTKTIVPCQPCHRPVCTMKEHRCMRDIPPPMWLISPSVCWERPRRPNALSPARLRRLEAVITKDRTQKPLTVSLEPEFQRPDRSPSRAFARSASARDAGRRPARRCAENR